MPFRLARVVGSTLLGFVALLASSASAEARARDLETLILPQPKAPILVKTCGGTVSAESGLAGFWSGGCIVVNRDSRDRTADTVRFHFEVYDAFGAILQTFSKDEHGTFSTGKDLPFFMPTNYGLPPHWPEPLSHVESRKLIIAIDRVLFSDGTTYIANIAADAKAFAASGGHAPPMPDWEAATSDFVRNALAK